MYESFLLLDVFFLPNSYLHLFFETTTKDDCVNRHFIHTFKLLRVAVRTGPPLQINLAIFVC